MKAVLSLLAMVLLAGCATTWVDPKINLRNSQIRVECLDDVLGMGPQIESKLNDAGIQTKPADSKGPGDLVLKVSYRFKKSDAGVYTVQAIKAEMVDGRYRSVAARYQWEGKGESLNDVAEKMVIALVDR